VAVGTGEVTIARTWGIARLPGLRSMQAQEYAARLQALRASGAVAAVSGTRPASPAASREARGATVGGLMAARPWWKMNA